jgi:1-acyl-sn-glycerol-3-phosphate acyltransferase
MFALVKNELFGYTGLGERSRAHRPPRRIEMEKPEVRSKTRRWIVWLKAVWLGFWAILGTIAVFVPVVAAARLDSSQRVADWICRAWARMLLFVTGVKTRSRGVEKIQRGVSYVIIVNHQSHFDVLALVLELPLCIRWVFKKELAGIPLFGWAVRSMRNVAVDRSNPASARASLEQGLRRLPAGASLLFFAEGTRSRDGRVGAFKTGGFRASKASGWPILPVVVHGSRKVLPSGSLDFRPGTIEVEVLDPISAEEVRVSPLDQLAERVRRAIVESFESPPASGIPSR